MKNPQPLSPDVEQRQLVFERTLTQALAESGTIAEVAARIIRLVCEAHGFACGALWTQAADSGTLVCAEVWGTAGTDIATFLEANWHLQLTREKAGLVRRAWHDGQPVWVADLAADASFLRAREAARAGLRSAFAFPARTQAGVIGVIEFLGRGTLPPDGGFLDSVASLGAGMGRFLQDKQIEDELLRLRAVVDAAPDLFFVVDPETLRFLYINEMACKVQGLSREEYLQVPPWQASGLSREELVRLYAEAIAQPGKAITSETFGRSVDNRRGWFETQRRARNVDGRWLIVITSREITKRKFAEESALRMGRMYAALSATNEAIMHSASPQDLFGRVCDAAVNGGKFMTAAVLVPDADTAWMKVVAVNGEGEKSLREARISVDEATAEGRGLVGTAFRTLAPCVSNDFLKDERTAPWHAAASQAGVKAGTTIPLARNGRAIGILLLYSSEKRAFDEDIVKLLERMVENITFALYNFERETERKRAEERVQYLATHDALTGLPNRMMFGQLIELEIEAARRYSHKFAVAFIDLDRFKDVNDTLGHDAGDALLKEMAARFKSALRASDVVARLGGDEFVILLREASDGQQVSQVAQKIVTAAMAPVSIDGQTCSVSASVGIALYPADAQDPQTLMKNADIAMYLAKDKGKNNFQFFAVNSNPR